LDLGLALEGGEGKRDKIVFAVGFAALEKPSGVGCFWVEDEGVDADAG